MSSTKLKSKKPQSKKRKPKSSRPKSTKPKSAKPRSNKSKSSQSKSKSKSRSRSTKPKSTKPKTVRPAASPKPSTVKKAGKQATKLINKKFTKPVRPKSVPLTETSGSNSSSLASASADYVFSKQASGPSEKDGSVYSAAASTSTSKGSKAISSSVKPKVKKAVPKEAKQPTGKAASGVNPLLFNSIYVTSNTIGSDLGSKVFAVPELPDRVTYDDVLIDASLLNVKTKVKAKLEGKDGTSSSDPSNEGTSAIESIAKKMKAILSGGNLGTNSSKEASDNENYPPVKTTTAARPPGKTFGACPDDDSDMTFDDAHLPDDPPGKVYALKPYILGDDKYHSGLDSDTGQSYYSKDSSHEDVPQPVTSNVAKGAAQSKKQEGSLYTSIISGANNVSTRTHDIAKDGPSPDSPELQTKAEAAPQVPPPDEPQSENPPPANTAPVDESQVDALPTQEDAPTDNTPVKEEEQ